MQPQTVVLNVGQSGFTVLDPRSSSTSTASPSPSTHPSGESTEGQPDPQSQLEYYSGEFEIVGTGAPERSVAISIFDVSRYRFDSSEVSESLQKISGTATDTAALEARLTTMQRMADVLTFRGGLTLSGNVSASIRLILPPGIYYFADFSSKLTSDDISRLPRFEVREATPCVKRTNSGPQVVTDARGIHLDGDLSNTLKWVRIENRRNEGATWTIFQPLIDGTSDELLQLSFNSHLEGVHADNSGGLFRFDQPTVGSGILSPSQYVDFSYEFPAGTYAALNMAPHASSGLPSALQGEHSVFRVS